MNILFTSVGRRTYLVEYFKQALSGYGKVYVANSTADTPTFRIADGHIVTPLIYADDYIPILKSYCIEKGIKAIISLFDVDLYMLAKHKNEFQDIGVTVVVSHESVIKICNDKWETYQFLLKKGFLTPRTFLSLEDAENALHCNKFKFPLIVKPRWGMASIGVYQADSLEELRVLYKKVKTNIRDSYLKYESDQDFESCVLIQEKLSGHEYGLDVINDLNGIYQNTIVKKKVAMRAGETDCAETVYAPELSQLGASLSQRLGHIANLDVDLFYNDGQAYVLEMNARFGGGYPFSHVAGVDLPYAIVKWLNSESVDPSILLPKYGVRAQKDMKIVCI